MPRDSRPTFPTYLLPSVKLPFRRPGAAPSSTLRTTAPGSSSSSTSTAPPRTSRCHPDTIRCGTCSSDLAFVSQIVSKGFTGRYGRAFLVAPPPPASRPTAAAASGPGDLVNIRVGKQESRQLVTGWHTVADFSCAVCSTKLGWKYVDARDASQKYKIGKFILETERVVCFRSWEDVLVPEEGGLILGASGGGVKTVGGDEVVFDSDDEDECEDIFAGTWDPAVVAKRRSRKVGRK